MMKSTYKLIGVEWDHRDIPRKEPNIAEETKKVQDIHTEYNLFDLHHYVRAVSLKEIWNTDFKNLPSLLNLAIQCDVIYLQIDIVPKYIYLIPCMFFSKRLLQTIAYLIDYYGVERVAPVWHEVPHSIRYIIEQNVHKIYQSISIV